MRDMLTNDLGAAPQPLVELAKRHKGGRHSEWPDRTFFEILLDLGQTGIPWRDLPTEFGSWDAAYNRFRRWVSSGSLEVLVEALTADAAFGDAKRVPINNTVVRAHAHAAGSRRRKTRSVRPGWRLRGASAGVAAG